MSGQDDLTTYRSTPASPSIPSASTAASIRSTCRAPIRTRSTSMSAASTASTSPRFVQVISTASNWEAAMREGRAVAMTPSALDGEIRDGRHVMAGAGLLRGHRLFRRRSITRAICASWSAAAPIICGCSAPTSARCSRKPRRRRRALPSWCARCRSSFSSPRAWTTCSTSITETQEVKGASVTLHQRVMRGEELLIDAQVQVAFVSGGRARRIPEPLRDRHARRSAIGRQHIGDCRQGCGWASCSALALSMAA